MTAGPADLTGALPGLSQSAAAVAGGGAATVDRVAVDRPEPAPRAQVREVAQQPQATPVRGARVAVATVGPRRSSSRSAERRAGTDVGGGRRSGAPGASRGGARAAAARGAEEFGVEGVESAAAAGPAVLTAQAAAPTQPVPTTGEFSAPPPSRSSAPSRPASTCAVADEFGPEG